MSQHAVIPYHPASPVPSPFPDDILEVLQIFQSDENQDLPRILALDAAYREEPSAYNDPTLHDIRFEQVSYIQGLIKHTNNVINCNRFYLGWLFIEASKRALYTYVGCDTLRQWCDSLHIERSILSGALQLAEIWPWLHQFGYTVYDVVDGSITEEKIKHLQHIAKDKGQVRDREVVAVYQEDISPHQPAPLLSKEETLEVVEEQEPSRPLMKAIRRVVSQLPKEEQAQFYEKVEDRYIQKMREKIEEVRQEDPDTFFAQQHALKGETVRPSILIECRRQGNEMYFASGHFHCGDGEIRSFIAGQVAYRYKIDGHVLTESEFGAYLDEHFAPDRTPSFSLGDDDD